MGWEIGGERYDFWREDDVPRTARKPHDCCECRERIQIGSPYYHFFGVLEHKTDNYDICPGCKGDWKDFMELIEDREPDACIIYSTLWEAIDWALAEELLTEEEPLVQKWLPRIAVRKEEEKKKLAEMRHTCPMKALGLP